MRCNFAQSEIKNMQITTEIVSTFYLIIFCINIHNF